jgi:hypothetical protein
MCDFTKGIKFCSCEPETIKFREKDFHKNLVIKLFRFATKRTILFR